MFGNKNPGEWKIKFIFYIFYGIKRLNFFYNINAKETVCAPKCIFDKKT